MAIYVWDKVKDYLTKAGTTIFVASIVLWFVLNFGIHGYETDVTQSFAAAIGGLLVPILKPAGLGTWQIAVALISGLSAKEVVVSSSSVLYGISNINSAAGMAELSKVLGIAGFGMANAYALLVFCLLYSPCVAAVGTIRRKNGISLKFTIWMVLLPDRSGVVLCRDHLPGRKPDLLKYLNDGADASDRNIRREGNAPDASDRDTGKAKCIRTVPMLRPAPVHWKRPSGFHPSG